MAAITKPSNAAAVLFNSPTLSDVKIKQIHNGKTREYFAHKAVLCFQSSFFLKAFTGNFKEATSNEMELHEDDPVHFEIALKFMYTLEYDSKAIKARPDRKQSVLTLIGISAIADKYDILNLHKPLADDLRETLKDKSIPHDVLKAVIHAYYSFCVRADTLVGRAIASAVLENHVLFAHTGMFQEVVKTHHEFGADIALEQVRTGAMSLRKVTCPQSSCRQSFAIDMTKYPHLTYCVKCRIQVPVQA